MMQTRLEAAETKQFPTTGVQEAEEWQNLVKPTWRQNLSHTKYYLNQKKTFKISLAVIKL